MKNLAISLLFIFTYNSNAEVSDIYGELGLETVQSTTNKRVKKLAGSVCKVLNRDGGGCCSAFFVAENIVMTNNHCLPCVHTYAKFTPSNRLNPLRHLSPIFGNPGPVKFRSYEELNQQPRYFNSIRIEDDNNQNFESIKVKEILSGSKQLDYLLLKVETPKLKTRVSKLSRASVKTGQKLTSISYPQEGKFADLKVFDDTDECKVYSPHHYSAPNSFSHQCDTESGSSGSPIFDKLTSVVVGLHKFGGAKSINWKPQEEIAPVFLEEDFREELPYEHSSNGATFMVEILNHIQKQRPEVYKRLDIK